MTVDNEANSMANISDVLAELKSLRSDFGSKLDNIDNCLPDVANSIVAIESKLSDMEQDVAANATRIGESETRIATTEDKVQHTQEALASATTLIAYLESKTEDLENRGRRTCGFLVYVNELKEISHFLTLSTTCYGSAVLIKLSLWSEFIAHWHWPNLTDIEHTKKENNS